MSELIKITLTVDENFDDAHSLIFLRRQGKMRPLSYEISITDEVLGQLKNLIGTENVRVN